MKIFEPLKSSNFVSLQSCEFPDEKSLHDLKFPKLLMFPNLENLRILKFFRISKYLKSPIQENSKKKFTNLVFLKILTFLTCKFSNLKKYLERFRMLKLKTWICGKLEKLLMCSWRLGIIYISKILKLSEQILKLSKCYVVFSWKS